MGNLEAWTHLIGFESILLIRAKISSKVKSVFVFKAYDWPEIVNRLDDEEKAYISWEEQEAQLKILMNSKSERPEIRQYAKRSSQSPLPGRPLELQKKGEYNELLDLCLEDPKELLALLPEDQKVDVRLDNRSIVRYTIKFFAVADEIDEKPIWGNSFLAQQHRKSLGFPDEKFD
ncbi:MAG: hypothetical protein ALECFALPRED_006957 [Alectoria fallacina]|uniref:Uncharacterized protein n=1 Tax=Alectoria fallacina TaxID=1903189 RepID=A0A8H3IXC1_9LECA|nr:MAG: hypothetical protein ALECFALPRED_006957 [Alectoria fallacina]